MKTLDTIHITPTYYSSDSVVGGGERYILYMCKALTVAGLDNQLNVTGSIVAFGEHEGDHELPYGVRCSVMPGRPWDPYSIEAGALRSKLLGSDVVFVHQCLSGFGLFAASHAAALGKIVIGVDHGGGEHQLVSHSAEVGRLYTLFLAQSEFAASSFRDLDGSTVIVRGPVDTEYFRPQQNVRRAADLVLAVGRILPHKGFDQIVRALPPTLRLVIAGHVYDSGYRDLLEQLKLGRRVEVCEGLSDLQILDLMQSATVFVHASCHLDIYGRYHAKPELLGLAPLEALSCGTPTLVSTSGALPELSCVKGCHVFRNEDDLRTQLERIAAGQAAYATPMEIHEDTDRHYGLRYFGATMLKTLSTAMASR